ncbi:BadF/BadG/BcrA/BcrD ATPase family protein [uncultured Clostridium sp.]|uniref:N-acetylglucosamine kinase n=1 Tax=uncultured Clostridium sp. TaxID=59620 RepID=UPI0028EE595D|nr:BadF/BadG/BcrA/BcrD ATPase family protein [uncultured Clostridium sp.]
MGYYIGIDGGGTKTICLLGNCNNEVIDSFKSGPTNYHSIGVKQTEEVFSSMFTYFYNKHNIDKDDIIAICLGGAGVDCEEDENLLSNIFRALGYKNKLLIFNDSITTLVGANGDMKGAILISGTGSISYGIDIHGNAVRVGGWGHIIDDDGSGFAIGRDALKKIMESYDGRSEGTILWEKISKTLEISNYGELIPFIYNSKKQHIADLAPLVLESYYSDKISRDIVDKAVEDLFKIVKTLSFKIKIQNFQLSFGGSVLLKSSLMNNLLKKKINDEFPKIIIHTPYEDSAHGALNLALKSNGY